MNLFKRTSLPLSIPRHWLQTAVLACVALAYWTILRLGLLFVAQPEGTASIWPASGFALAILLLNPRHQWAKFLSVIFVVNAAGNWNSGNTLPVSLGFALANILEAFLSAWVLVHFCKSKITFGRTVEIIVLLGAAVFVNGITAILGAAVSDVAFGTPFVNSWMVWWAADGLGIVLVTPFIVTWATHQHMLRSVSPRWLIEIVLSTVLLTAFAWLLYGSFTIAEKPLLHNYMLFPVLIWLAFRYSPRGMAGALFIVATIAIWNILHGYGIFAYVGQTVTERLAAIQIFLSVAAFSGLVLSAIVTEMRLAEKTLLLTRMSVESASESLFWMKPNGTFVDVNEAACRMLGYTREELLQMSVPDVDAHYNAEKWVQHFPELRKHGTLKLETEHRAKDGRLIPVEIVANYIQRGDEEYNCAFVRDITERKRVEEQLQRTSERLHLATVSAKAGVWDWNLQTNEMIWDDRMLELYGLTAENFPGGSEAWTHGLHPDDAASAIEKCQAAIRGDREFDTEFRVQHPDDTIVYIKANGLVLRDGNGIGVRMIGLNTDITERKHGEEKLHESEERYRSLFEHAGDLILILELSPDGPPIIRDVNNMTLHSLGYSRDELLNKPIGFIEPEVSMATIHARAQVILTKQREGLENMTPDFEIRHKRKDGSFFDTEVRAQQIMVGGKHLAIVIERDITKRKQADEALNESEDKFKYIFEYSMVGKSITHLDGKVHMNKAFCDMVGYSIKEMQDATWQDITHPDDIELTQRQIGSLISGDQESVRFFKRFIHKKGSVVWVDLSSTMRRDKQHKPLYLMTTAADITDRKHNELVLAQEKERLSVTLRSIGDGVITTDTDGSIVMINRAAEELTGWKSEDVVGRPLPEVFCTLNAITREPCDNPVEKILSTGNIVELGNHTCLISKDGREIQIVDSGAPIRDNESRIIGAVLVFRDMTEKGKLNEAMQRAQKLESLGTLAGGIAHDFNNMLAGIFGYLDLAKESIATNNSAQVPKYLDKALGVYDRAKGLTQQLLTFSKGGAPVRKTQSIAPLIQHSATFALSGSNVSCQFNLAEDLWACDCDENQIGQVIDNIVINGKQAMPKGGAICISCTNDKEVPGHLGMFVRISIKDEGQGIPHDILPKIFDPFFSTKTTGHGLGLATVFSIIQRHDGWIDVESTVGKGSTFHIFIPASQKTAAGGIGNNTLKHTGTGTILVMDDEEFILEILDSMLQEMGYTVVQANNGKVALALFTDAEKSGHSFAASILDLTIPGGAGGKETAAAMLKINPNSVVIVSSGYSEDPVVSNPTKHGFTDRIIKPYRKNELTELMMRVMIRSSLTIL